MADADDEPYPRRPWRPRRPSIRARSRVARPDPLTSVPRPRRRAEQETERDAEQMSLARRLRQPRTILSIAVPLAIIAVFVASTASSSAKVPSLILGANPLLVLVAFVVFYAGFPLRGQRWSLLLRGTGFRIGTKDSTEIIFLSWLVNCVVPAKLGDVYRAYLLKINSTASLSRTFGTVFIERVLDLFAIALLGIAAGLLELPRRAADRHPARVRHRTRRRGRARGRPVHDAQLRASDHRRPAAAAAPCSSCTTGSRRACSVRWRSASCRSSGC